MGNTISWCCGKSGNNDTDIQRKTSNKFPIPSQEVQRSKPQTILQGPVFDPNEFQAKYELKSYIGTGSTSICHVCKKKSNHKEYACKIIDLRTAKKSDGLLEQFEVEIQVLQALHHPNIIHLEDAFQTDSKIYMITELMNGGELFEYIVEKGTLSEVEASNIVRKVTAALAYMHANGIVHRDMKPENLLLTKKSPDAEVKIIDFGLAKMLHDKETKSFLGTRGYLAPEMLRRLAYSKAVDVWALGVIVYVLLCGCLPFDDDGSEIVSEEAAKKKIKLRFPRWASGLSESAKDLLRKLLEVDSTKRYTAELALSHPWVAGKKVPNKMLESPKHLRQIQDRIITPKKTRPGTKQQRNSKQNGNTDIDSNKLERRQSR